MQITETSFVTRYEETVAIVNGVCVCACACVRACVCAYARVRVYMSQHLHLFVNHVSWASCKLTYLHTMSFDGYSTTIMKQYLQRRWRYELVYVGLLVTVTHGHHSKNNNFV